jgi:hypothetical protein
LYFFPFFNLVLWLFSCQVALVLTDGIQTKDKGPFTSLHIASSRLQNKDVNVYSLGVGSDIDVTELLDMASGKDFVFSARNFDDLSTRVKEITEAQCQGMNQRESANTPITCDTREKRLRMLEVCMQMTRIRHFAIVNIWKFHFHTCFNNGLHKMPKLRVSYVLES